MMMKILEWKDRANNQHTLTKAQISSMKWASYGNKASVHIIDADGKSIKFDGIYYHYHHNHYYYHHYTY